MTEKFNNWAEDKDFVAWLRDGQFRLAGVVKWSKLLASASIPKSGGTQAFLIESMWSSWNAFEKIHSLNRSASHNGVGGLKWIHAKTKPPDRTHLVVLFSDRDTGFSGAAFGFFQDSEFITSSDTPGNAAIVGWFIPDIPNTDEEAIEDLIESGGPLLHGKKVILTGNQMKDFLVSKATSMVEDVLSSGLGTDDIVELAKSFGHTATPMQEEKSSSTKKSRRTAKDLAREKKRRRTH